MRPGTGRYEWSYAETRSVRVGVTITRTGWSWVARGTRYTICPS